MKGLLKNGVEQMASLSLCTWLLAAMCTVLFWGLYHIKGNEMALSSLGTMNLFEWLIRYETIYPGKLWWFASFVLFVFILSINTLFCTIRRIRPILATILKAPETKVPLFKRLMIHGIHLSFLLITLGYFLSFTKSEIHPSIILTPNGPSHKIDEDTTIRLMTLKKLFYKGHMEAMKGRIVGVDATLNIHRGKTDIKQVLRPDNALIMGNLIVSIRDFSKDPKRDWVKIYVRKDHGLWYYLFGSLAFVTVSITFGGYGLMKKIGPKSCNWRVCPRFEARGAKAYLGIPSPEQQRRLGKIANPEGRQKGAKNCESCIH